MNTLMDVKVVDEFIESIKERIGLDEFDLVRQCKEQPGLHVEVSEMFVIWKAEAKRAKEGVAITIAELSDGIRRNPEKYGITKITVDAVSTAVLLQKECQEEKLQLIEIERISDSLSLLLSSIEQRKSMIRDLVSLFIFDYYGKSDMKGDQEEVAKVNERNIKAVRARRSRRNRDDG